MTENFPATPRERRTRVLRHRRAKRIWYVIAGIQLIGCVTVLQFLIVQGWSRHLTVIGGVTGTAIVVVGLLILYGLWRMAPWVRWVVWIEVALTVPWLLSRFIVPTLVPLAVAFGYQSIAWALRSSHSTDDTTSTPPRA